MRLTHQASLAHFLLEAQSRVTSLQERQYSLIEMRSRAEDFLKNVSQKLTAPLFFQSSVPSKLPMRICEFIMGKELQTLFRIVGETEDEINLENFIKPKNQDTSAILLPPGYWLRDQWSGCEESFLQSYATAIAAGNSFLFRTGFLSSEFEIYESLLLGFRGISMHATTLDEFQIQFLTEVCRDFKMCLIWLVEDKEVLNRVLKTDAPYLAIFLAPDEKGERNLTVLRALAPKIPNSCPKIAFLPGARPNEMKYAYASGFTCVFGST